MMIIMHSRMAHVVVFMWKILGEIVAISGLNIVILMCFFLNIILTKLKKSALTDVQKIFKKLLKKKIWNEERPANMANTFEIRVMLNRALGLPDNYQFFRKHFALMCEDKIIRGKMKLWNEERPYDLVSDVEIAIMFTRAVVRNSELSVNALMLTREQVAEVCGRDFL